MIVLVRCWEVVRFGKVYLRAVPFDGAAAEAVEGDALGTCCAADAPEVVVEGVAAGDDGVPLAAEIGSWDEGLGWC